MALGAVDAAVLNVFDRQRSLISQTHAITRKRVSESFVWRYVMHLLLLTFKQVMLCEMYRPTHGHMQSFATLVSLTTPNIISLLEGKGRVMNYYV